MSECTGGSLVSINVDYFESILYLTAACQPDSQTYTVSRCLCLSAPLSSSLWTDTVTKQRSDTAMQRALSLAAR